MAAENGPPAPPPPPPPPVSPPKAEVDDSPLHKSMDKNKESLKVKLMLRRPINQLVAQGILPPLKTPQAFHEQRQKLERAKMGDLLKAKIQQRPGRDELVRQHILEDVGHVDPSLAERQRMLKKCKLADSLNDQLSHRPGPLELIKKNILHTDEPIERAVKEGHIEFKATCEGKTKPTHPDHYMTLDDDSQSSEGAGSPAEPPGPPPTRDVLETAAAQAGIVTVVVPASALLTTAPSPSSLSLSSLSPLSSISSPPSTSAATPTTSRTPQPQPGPSPAPGKDKNRKKSKTKTQPKTRTIKFHEYKGPPNAQKNSSLNASNVETSYELLLQQQQLFLQWQLEWQHKYPQIILPAAQKSPEQPQSLITVTTAPPPPPLPQQSPQQPPPDTRPLRNLEDMKVSDLKAELKRRNLPVSGAKPQLIERLKPYSDSPSSVTLVAQHDSDSLLSVCNVSPPSVEEEGLTAPPTPASPATPASVAMETQTEASEEIIREQKRRIEQLQRQLLRSQLQLQQSQSQQTTFQPQQTINAKANLAAFLQQQQLNQLLLQQQQQQQLQQQQQQQQQQQPQLISIISNNNNNNNINNNNNSNKQHRTNGLVAQPLLINMKTATNNQRTSSLPNFVGTFVQTVPSQTILSEPTVTLQQPPVPQQPQEEEMPEEKPDLSALPPLLPPLYHDATKLLRVKQEVDDIKGVKSQIVDDVLDILIKNGELPPSAAQDPYPSGVDLRELGLDLEPLEGMELGDAELMDVDTDWLDHLMEAPAGSPQGPGDGGHDVDADTSLLDSQHDPFDVFATFDDPDFRMLDLGWDRVDFAT